MLYNKIYFLLNFIKMYYIRVYKTNSVPKELIEIIKKDSTNTDYDKDEIYGEQLSYINAKAPNSYFVAAFNDGIYLGGVVLFLETSKDDNYYIDTPSPGFQGIAKSIDGLNDSVKLNSLLIPYIVNFVKTKTSNDKIYVRPIGKQKDILLKHYQFSYLNNDDDLMVRNLN